jgi:hypothetical protein
MCLFLRFLEHDVLSELLGIFFELNLALDTLHILARPVDLSGLF